MPAIKSSADLRNNYNEISTFCHNYPEPVFITKNGKDDLAVMSIEAYEEMTSRFELYSQILSENCCGNGETWHLCASCHRHWQLRRSEPLGSC